MGKSYLLLAMIEVFCVHTTRVTGISHKETVLAIQRVFG